MLFRFICVLFLCVGDESSGRLSNSLLHLRCDEDRYGEREHSSSDQFIGDIRLNGRAVFLVSLDKSVFEGVKKWDNSLRSIPINLREARAKLNKARSKLFEEKREWQLEEVFLYSVSEVSGDYVWMGAFVEVTEGGYSFAPTVFAYLNMNGKVLVPKPAPGKEKEFSHIFDESFRQ